MAHIFDYEIKNNGALSLLKGSPLTVLVGYMLFADAHGNSWPSSRSGKPAGALNRATGLSHSAITNQRDFLERHGVLAKVERNTVKQLYAGDRRPPINSNVWHITGVIRRCNVSDCACSKKLQVKEASLYYFATSSNSEHEVNITEDSKVNITLEENPGPSLFFAICLGKYQLSPGDEVTESMRGQASGLVSLFKELEASAADVTRFYAWVNKREVQYRPSNHDSVRRAYDDFLLQGRPAPAPKPTTVEERSFERVPRGTA